MFPTTTTPSKVDEISFRKFSWDDVDLSFISPRIMYTLGEEIGNGSTSIVYHATHPIHKKVAVKKYYPQYSCYAEVEIKWLRKVQGHPHFTSVFDTWNDDDEEKSTRCAYIAMERVDDDILQLVDFPYHSTLTIPEIVDCIQQLLTGLAYLHNECKLVHFDLKPENIGYTLQPNGRRLFKILDLGTVESLDTITRPYFQSKINSGYMIITTSEYRSYEAVVRDGVQKHGEKSDVWALGCIIYEMIWGKQLFMMSDTNSQAINKIILEEGLDRIHTATIDSSDYAVAINVMRKCLIKDVESRYSVSQLLQFVTEQMV